MALFPLFVNLINKKCLIVGGGEVAARKAQILVDFGADVTVISPEIKDGILNLESEGRVKVLLKKFCSGDLNGSNIVIAATSDDEINKLVHEEAVRLNIPVNVVDCPERCTFVFPAIVKREQLVIGISTSGGFPALSKSIKEKLERTFPQESGEILSVLEEYRKKTSVCIENNERRTAFLKRIADESFVVQGYTKELLIERIENILKGYRHEKDNQGRDKGEYACNGTNRANYQCHKGKTPGT